MALLGWIIRKYNKYISKDRQFVKAIYNITGVIPTNIEVYKLAFRHSSVSSAQTTVIDSNERLEYLGDAILGALIADYLFKKYPTRSEGYLTEMRSKIVGRSSLNVVGLKMGLDVMMELNPKNVSQNRSISGNAFEALVGALYLDIGYEGVRYFLKERFIRPYFNIEALEEQNLNFKSQLLEYLQKKQIPLPNFVTVSERQKGQVREFVISCELNGVSIGQGLDIKKKNAEQKAAEQAYHYILAQEKEELERLRNSIELSEEEIEEESQAEYDVIPHTLTAENQE